MESKGNWICTLQVFPSLSALDFSLETLQELGHLLPGIQMDTSHTKGTGKMATWLSLGDLWKWTKISVYLAATTLLL